MKFKVGDRVKVINCEIEGRECENLGKIFTIKSTDKNGNSFPYELYGTPEFFGDNELELVNKFTKADLKDGDKCTLKNGQVIFVDKTSDYGFSNINEQLKYFNDDVSIAKVERPVKYETMFERKEEILDEVEKKYLADVVRPFRSKVRSVYKMAPICSNKEFINIQLRDENFTLPYFKKGTMYKEMQTGKRYTLEKLGI
jgi:hypothetical protein|nr:MAG TPA: hypothetical protein [Caudoviricetes sp.]